MDIQIIGKQITNGRKDKNLSQVVLAEMLGITPQAVNKWEKGKSLPDIFMLAKIADIFDIYDIGYFLEKAQCPNEFCNCLKGGKNMENSCGNLETIEEFVEYWQSCSLEALKKIAHKYNVKFNEGDTKEMLVIKLTSDMNEWSQNNE